jgi:hypothetical protein
VRQNSFPRALYDIETGTYIRPAYRPDPDAGREAEIAGRWVTIFLIAVVGVGIFAAAWLRGRDDPPPGYRAPSHAYARGFNAEFSDAAAESP